MVASACGLRGSVAQTWGEPGELPGDVCDPRSSIAQRWWEPGELPGDVCDPRSSIAQTWWEPGELPGDVCDPPTGATDHSPLVLAPPCRSALPLPSRASLLIDLRESK